jgi:hypothetical protein
MLVLPTRKCQPADRFRRNVANEVKRMQVDEETTASTEIESENKNTETVDVKNWHQKLT